MEANVGTVKELLQSQMASLNEKIDSNNRNLAEKIDTNNENIMEHLKYIKAQTEKTNGRVNQHDRDLQRMTEQGNIHLLNCPRREEIDEIKKELRDISDQTFIVKVFNKYPRQVLILFVVTVILSIASFGYTVITMKSVIQKLKNETKTVQQLEQHDGFPQG